MLRQAFHKSEMEKVILPPPLPFLGMSATLLYIVCCQKEGRSLLMQQEFLNFGASKEMCFIKYEKNQPLT